MRSRLYYDVRAIVRTVALASVALVALIVLSRIVERVYGL